MAKAIRKAVRKTNNKDNRNAAVTNIDFGIGALEIKIVDGSAIVIKEFVEAIKKAALTVPVRKLTESINQYNRF